MSNGLLLLREKPDSSLTGLECLKESNIESDFSQVTFMQIIMAAKSLLSVIWDHWISLMSLCVTGTRKCVFSKNKVLSAFLGFHFILHLALKLFSQFFSIPLAGPFSLQSLVNRVRS